MTRTVYNRQLIDMWIQKIKNVDSRVVNDYFMAILLKRHNNVYSSAQTLIVPQIFHCMCVTENMIIGCF